MVREALCRLGEQPDDYGLRSFRAEGATAAANAGIKDQLFKNMVDGSLKVLKMLT